MYDGFPTGLGAGPFLSFPYIVINKIQRKKQENLS